MILRAATFALAAACGLALPAAARPQAAASAAAAPSEAVVLTAVENMYSGPDAGRDVVSQALFGQVVGVLETKDGFARVETPDKYQGWVAAGALLAYDGPKAPRYARAGLVADVTSLMANLYRDPDVTTARPKAQAPLGARLEVLPAVAAAGEGGTPPEPSERWIAVRLPSGDSAYVQRGDVAVKDAPFPRPRGTTADLVATARRFLGVPYLWGGMSPLGVDCSGFVSQVYAVNGVDLLRDADMQHDDPRASVADRKGLRAGDLLFFGRKKITHVGMYVGDGRFIHATTHQRPVVQESDLGDPHWTSLFRGARRMPEVAAP